MGKTGANIRSFYNSVFKLIYPAACSSLAFLGFALLLLIIIIIKAKTTVNFSLSPLIYIYSIFVVVFQLTRLIMSMFYKSALNSVVNGYNTDPFLPSVSFVIPCKNEEKVITHTLTKCLQADYPKDKLEVIVINDGSTDRTLDIIMQVKKIYPQLNVISWGKNRGKREAMAEGFRRAKGEILIQLDSDSYIEPGDLRNLVKLFINPKVGAVCAHADVQNADESLITRMQAAYYYLSFRIMKAAESAMYFVFCCSGCASAYRRAVVMPILDSWLNEKFLGNFVTYGDDRALTTWVLKSGYYTIYTDEVQAYTIVPVTAKQLIKQQIRWKKSWIINAIFTLKYIFKQEPLIGLFYFLPLAIISFITPFIAFYSLVISVLFFHSLPVYYIMGIIVVTTVFILYSRTVNIKNKYWKYLYHWQIVNIFFLSFIMIYAVIKIRDRGWGTR